MKRKRATMSHIRLVTPRLRWLSRESFSGRASEPEREELRPGEAIRSCDLPRRCMRRLIEWTEKGGNCNLKCVENPCSLKRSTYHQGLPPHLLTHPRRLIMVSDFSLTRRIPTPLAIVIGILFGVLFARLVSWTTVSHPEICRNISSFNLSQDTAPV